MAWIPITTEDVTTRLSGTELECLQGLALADNQIAPLEDVIDQAVGLIHGYIGASKSGVGPDGTIPSTIMGPALAIIRWYIGGRLAVGNAASIFQSEPRRKEYEDAIRLLESIVKGEFAVESPETESTEDNFAKLAAAYGSEDALTF